MLTGMWTLSSTRVLARTEQIQTMPAMRTAKMPARQGDEEALIQHRVADAPAAAAEGVKDADLAGALDHQDGEGVERVLTIPRGRRSR